MSFEEMLAATVRVAVREEVRSAVREALAETHPATSTAYLSVTRAAAVADVDPETIRRWLSKGLLPNHRAEPTSQSRIRRDELDQLLAAKPKEPGEPDVEAMADTILRKGGR